MLIEFSVSNFRSIRETLTLSTVASKYYTDLDETNCCASPVIGLPNLLKAAVVYGPNAAGKSNLFKALHFMQAFVLHSHAHTEGARINVTPFALDETARDKPSEFEIFFVGEGVRYQFGFTVNQERIVKE